MNASGGANSWIPLAARINATPIGMAASAKSRNRTASFSTTASPSASPRNSSVWWLVSPSPNRNAARYSSVSLFGRHIHM